MLSYSGNPEQTGFEEVQAKAMKTCYVEENQGIWSITPAQTRAEYIQLMHITLIGY